MEFENRQVIFLFPLLPPHFFSFGILDFDVGMVVLFQGLSPPSLSSSPPIVAVAPRPPPPSPRPRPRGAPQTRAPPPTPPTTIAPGMAPLRVVKMVPKMLIYGLRKCEGVSPDLILQP